MLRLTSAILVAVLVAFPVAVLPAAPVTWLAAVAFIVAAAGVALLSVPVVTAGASLTLIAHALALVVTRPPLDPVAATAFGATLVVLLALVHFASRVHGAAVGPAVIVGQIRQWLVIAGLGVGAAGALVVGGTVLGVVLGGTTLPVVIVAAALGALLAMAGLLALVTAGLGSPGRPDGPTGQ
jgi:hypothetical protein